MRQRSALLRHAAATTATAVALALAAPLVSPAQVSAAPDESRRCDAFTEPRLRASVPTAQEVLGIELGERDVTTRESDRYLRAVAKASPRVAHGVLARSWDGRALRYAVVGKAAWVKPGALRRIGRSLNELRDADTSPSRARSLARRTPAVLWVAGNVHGNEESGADASLRVLYELAARTDCAASQILDRAIVVVLPTQNPDGREADTRRNSYGFDLNRDWFARTQRETDGKVAKLRELPPQMFIDAHEMSREDYFFPPNADPVYHDIGETPLHWIYDVYGPAMQRAFKRFSIPFFNGDVYDLFYMGYGDTVPSTGFNAAGMTFEKANADPASMRVQEQYTAIWATLSAAGRRHSLVREWRAEHVKAAREGRRGKLEPNRLYWEGVAIENQVPDRRVRHYFLQKAPSKGAELGRLVQRLQRMDVDVYQLTRRLRVPDFRPYGHPRRVVTLPRGTYWVPMAQGQKHWVQAMLNEDTYVPFPYFYDVTAFSGPLLNNVPGGYSGARLTPRAKVAKVSVRERAESTRGRTLAVWQPSEESTASVESAGWLRWYLDRRLRVPYDDLAAGDFTAEGLADVDVLVVPNVTGEAAQAALDALGTDGQAALRGWVDAGGRLVTLRGGSTLAESLGLTTAVSAEPTSAIPGALVRVEVDRSSPLGRGVGRTAYAMYEEDLVWSAPSRASVAVRFPGRGDPDWFISGFAQGAGELRGAAAVVDEAYGEGRVVLFGFDPNFRAFTDGTQKLLRNALLGRTPDDLPEVPQVTRRAPATELTRSVHDRMVVSVESTAVDEVRRLLSSYGASAETVKTQEGVSFRIDLGHRTADEHPWALSLAQDVTDLGDQVVMVRVP
jgi:hypothetical protein